MIRICLTKGATEMIYFLLDCHPDAEQIHEANSNQSAERNSNEMGL